MRFFCPTPRCAPICRDSSAQRFFWAKSPAISRFCRSLPVPGRTEKTTLLEAISWALGDYAATADPALLMVKRGDSHPTGVADLRGRRFVTIAETEQGRGLDIALAKKRMSGGDRIKARYMRRDFIEFSPSWLMFMATNHLPAVDDGSEAVWRRLRVIPFDVVVPAADRDDQLPQRLQMEADAVLAWIVAGWTAYRGADSLDTPDAVRVATNVYRCDSDSIGRFVAEECLLAPGLSATTKKMLYESWERFAKREGLPPGSKVAFGRTLDSKGFPADQSSRGMPRRGIAPRPQAPPDSDTIWAGER